MVDGDIVVAQFSEQLGWGDANTLVEDIAGDSVAVNASINDNAQACVVWQQVIQNQQDNILSVCSDDRSRTP